VLLAWIVTGNANVVFPFTGQALAAENAPAVPISTGLLTMFAIFSTAVVDFVDTSTPNGRLCVLLMCGANFLLLSFGIGYLVRSRVSGWAWAVYGLDVLVLGINAILLRSAIGQLGQQGDPPAVYGKASTTLISVIGVIQCVCGALNMSAMDTRVSFISVFEANGPLFINGCEFLTLGGETEIGELLKFFKEILNVACASQILAGMILPSS
jgi:hypothetical protein